jgi:uncharacterized protein (DUF58 family)
LRDRQYVSSLALSIGILVLVLVGLAAVPLWLGWAGVAALVMIAGGFLVWFYWGPRPDLQPRDSPDGGTRADDD